MELGKVGEPTWNFTAAQIAPACIVSFHDPLLLFLVLHFLGNTYFGSCLAASLPRRPLPFAPSPMWIQFLRQTANLDRRLVESVIRCSGEGRSFPKWVRPQLALARPVSCSGGAQMCVSGGVAVRLPSRSCVRNKLTLVHVSPAGVGWRREKR